VEFLDSFLRMRKFAVEHLSGAEWFVRLLDQSDANNLASCFKSFADLLFGNIVSQKVDKDSVVVIPSQALTNK